MSKPKDPRLKKALGSIKTHRSTRLNRARLATLWHAAANVTTVPGAVAEVGSYRGGSAYFIASSFRGLLGHGVPMEVIDTFEGHPQDKLSSKDSPLHTDVPMFTDTSYEHVVEYLSPFEEITVHKGEFSSVALALPEQSYRLVHLDVDLYEPTLAGLRYFGPRLSQGGVMVLDDYGKPSCPGVEAAANEFRAESPGFQAWEYPNQLVLVKAIS